jgi:hypothetical protein
MFYAGYSSKSPLNDKDPILLFSAFIVIALTVFGALVREWANTAIKLQAELLRLTFGRKRGGLTNHDEALLKSFPHDIRTARKLFDIEAVTTTYAACPKCSATYRVDEDNRPPLRCTRRRYANVEPCNEKLTKLVVKDDESGRRNVRAPIRPFLVQDFDAFKASLLNRPGMEALLDRGTLFNDTEDMWDVKDGVAVKELPGPDGKPFWDGLKRSELRLVWTLSIDWFNPRGNKAAGKAVSAGSIVMACLNLPPSLRYRPENLYLVGVIPGPREPSVEEVEYFVRPVVEMLNRSWREGTKFSTESAEGGRVERSMVAAIVTDMVATRKIMGIASHSSKEFFCSLCGLSKENINNLDQEAWPTRTREAQKKAAEDWRDATTKGERQRLFKQNGVRWSPFWILEYFDPVKMSVIDGMHNLFLGLVQFHVREVLGVDDAQSDENSTSRPVTEKELDDARRGMAKSNLKAMGRARVATLKQLCVEKGIDLSSTRRVKKKKLIQYLLVSYQSLLKKIVTYIF